MILVPDTKLPTYLPVAYQDQLTGHVRKRSFVSCFTLRYFRDVSYRQWKVLAIKIDILMPGKSFMQIRVLAKSSKFGFMSSGISLFHDLVIVY